MREEGDEWDAAASPTAAAVDTARASSSRAGARLSLVGAVGASAPSGEPRQQDTPRPYVLSHTPAHPDAMVEHALRIVVVVALPRDEAARLVAHAGVDEAVSRWPSSLYGWLTRQMLASPGSWRCAAACLDARLAPWLERFRDRTPFDLAQTFVEGRDAWSARELAALLWALLRRRETAGQRVARRLSDEIEVAVLQRCPPLRTP